MTQKEKAPRAGGAGALQKGDADNSTIALAEKRGEPRVDSRLIAKQLGVEHRASMQLIRNYKADFGELGVLTFQMSKPARPTGGRPERYALLNEDQSYLLLTYSQNTPQARQLKIKLVRAFSEARRKAEIRQEYLPGYHELHDQLQALAEGASNPHLVHINANKLLNKAAGIQSGARGTVPAANLARLMVAQQLATAAMHDAVDHREAYARAKAAVEPLLHLELPEG